MPNPTGAQVASPTTSRTTPSTEGNPPQKSQEQLLAEYRAENERKQEVIEELRESQQAQMAEMAELKQLILAGQATRADVQQFNALNSGQADIESQLALLEADPKNKLGYLSIDRRIEKKMKEMEGKVQAAEIAGEQKALGKLQMGLIEDTAEKLGMDFETFRKKLIPIAAQYQFDSQGQPINVYRKAQLAIRKYEQIEAEKKAEAERLKAAQANGSQESGTREARNPSPLDDRNKKLRPGNFGDEMKALGL